MHIKILCVESLSQTATCLVLVSRIRNVCDDDALEQCRNMCFSHVYVIGRIQSECDEKLWVDYAITHTHRSSWCTQFRQTETETVKKKMNFIRKLFTLHVIHWSSARRASFRNHKNDEWIISLRFSEFPTFSKYFHISFLCRDHFIRTNATQSIIFPKQVFVPKERSRSEFVSVVNLYIWRWQPTHIARQLLSFSGW